MTQLRVCDACSRHVFVTEKSCPFCNAPLGEAPQRTFGQRLRRGMSRAQLLAVAAAVGGVGGQTLAACSDTEQNDGVPNAGTTAGAMAGTDGAGEGGDGAGEGGASGTMGGTGGAGAGGAGAGGTGGAGSGGLGGDIGQPVYGGPVDPDDAGVDAGEDAGDFAMPEYGASPVPED